MKKIEYMAMSLPSGLKLSVPFIYEGFVCDLVIVNNTCSLKNGMDIITANHNEARPIVRPLPDLTKEITQADYNGGKPFLPIVEIKGHCRSEYFEDNINGLIKTSIFHELLPFWVIQFLIKWHFDLITEPCEKVYVTDEFNPYI